MKESILILSGKHHTGGNKAPSLDDQVDRASVGHKKRSTATNTTVTEVRAQQVSGGDDSDGQKNEDGPGTDEITKPAPGEDEGKLLHLTYVSFFLL